MNTIVSMTLDGVRRALLPTLVIAAGVSSLAAQGTATAHDSTKSDSAAHATKAPKRGLFARAASAATQAANAVEQHTGVNAGDALQTAGMIAAKSNPAYAMLQGVQQVRGMQAAQAAGQTAQAAQAAQSALASGGAMRANAAPLTGDAVQAQFAQLVQRASAGDTVAGRQIMRFQMEMMTAVTQLASVPATQRGTAMQAAMHAAFACATTNQQCRTATGH